MDVELAQGKHKPRGKLYALSEDSAWEDTGTGYATIAGTGDARRLVFQEEESGKVLHDRPVFGSDTYQLQGEGERRTIIVWEDAETQKDWALSFQDADGTVEIWEAIRRDGGAEEKRVLPLPSLGTLGDLCRMLTCVPPSQRETFAGECASAKFLAGLRDAFHTAEDLGSDEALGSLWQVAKGIFLLSNQRLTERYLQQDVYEDVLGMLEYDVGLPSNRRLAHRQILKAQVCFRHVLAFEDAEMLERIHLNYRLQYLKDIVLPRLLDDAAFVSLTQMIHTNLSVILDHLQKSDRLLEQLLQQIRRRDPQSLLFLQDACRLAKQIAPHERQALHEKLAKQQLFEVLVAFFGDEGAGAEREALGLRYVCVEILLLSTHNDPSHLRRFLTAEGSTEGRSLLRALIATVLHGEDQGVQGQAAEILKAVMETATLEPRERDGCLDAFYERGALDELSAPLRIAEGGRQPVGPCELFGQQLSCELLAFAVAHHGYRARVYVMRHGVAQQAVRLLAAPQRFLQLAPVRLLRAAVGTKDDAYHRYLAKNGLFAPLFRAFQQSLRPPALGGNLLISATLEVLEVIRVENIKVLVDHICRKHEGVLREHAPKIRTLHLLLVRHQQNLEYEAFPPELHASGGPIAGAGGAGAARPSRARSPGREDSDDDEAYFGSVDEDEDEDEAGAGTLAEGRGADSLEGPPQRLAGVSAGGAAAKEAPGAHTGGGMASAGAHGGAAANGVGEGSVSEGEDAVSPLRQPSHEGDCSPGLPGLLGSYAEEDDEEALAAGRDVDTAATADEGAEPTAAAVDASGCGGSLPPEGAAAAGVADAIDVVPAAGECAAAAPLQSAALPAGDAPPSPPRSPPRGPEAMPAASGRHMALGPAANEASALLDAHGLGGTAVQPSGTPPGSSTADSGAADDACSGLLGLGSAAEKAANHAPKRLKTSAAAAVGAPA